MHLFRTIVLLAALVGLGAGLVLTLVQQFGTQPLIVQAEMFEAARAEAPALAETHVHADGSAHAHAAAGHSHDAGAWAPADGLERFGWTLFINILTGVGFALLLVAASELKGGLASWREGLLWGLGGFAAFTLAPSIGLPPEAPGVTGAALEARQIWWLATAAATAFGVALLAYGRSPLAAVAAIVLLAAPHVIGAPQATEAPAIPRTLEHDFAVAVIVTGLLFWATIGALAGFARRRFADA